MSDGHEVDEIAQTLGRSGAAVLSAALITARIAMRRRAERAEQARQADERRQQDIARELHAERELAAVQWQRVNLRQWFRENPQQVAQTWASAATWAEQDPRAKEAFESLNLHLDRLGTHDPELAQALLEAGDYNALAELLKQGADEAYGRLTGDTLASEPPTKPDTEPATKSASEAPADDVARWERVSVTRQVNSARQLGDLWASAKTWAPYDPDAAETTASLNTDLARHNVRFPSADEVGPDLAKSQALAELLDNGATQAAQHAGPEGDFVRFASWYMRDPANALARLDTHLAQTRTEQPGYYAALQDAAAHAGADNLSTWFANNLYDAYKLTQEHFTHPSPDIAENGADSTAQASAPAPAQPTTRMASPGRKIYQSGTRAPGLAGLGFAATTAESISRGGKPRRAAAAIRRWTRAARKKQQHSQG